MDGTYSYEVRHSVTLMCPLQVVVYCLQVSWPGREAPPKVEHIKSCQKYLQNEIWSVYLQGQNVFKVLKKGGPYLDVVGVSEEHGEAVDAHAPSCRGWKAVL